jgi:hypothetical protein
MKMGYLFYHISSGSTKYDLKPLGRLLQALHIARFSNFNEKPWDTMEYFDKGKKPKELEDDDDDDWCQDD